jgi:chromosome segregation protein
MTIAESVPPRLTRLEMQGFKSFASRTVFVFDPGITAIIGPNGSGKSNISDGVRWVLGEMSHSLLRSRKTEDVIFAGGNGRSPAGMAEVTVTFDNASGWLPIEFTEVAVTRRAFRSGENQYLINNRKVRLKDVQQLTASLGHSYTVVGQGLVDAALSQRAEERRGLFEHAADLTGLQMKVQEAERNLAEAEANAERINDLLAEVEPRLRTLERAAKQAREWQGVHDRLRWLEQGYYRHALQGATAAFREAEAGARAESAAAQKARESVERLAGELRESRVAADGARSLLDRQRAHLDTVSDQLRRVGHERELAVERLSALRRRQEDMRDTQQGLDEQSAAVERDLETVEADLGEATRAREESRRAHAELQRQATRSRDAQSARERQTTQLAAAALSIERQLSDIQRQRAVLEQRQQSGVLEQERAAASAAERDRKIAGLRAELASLESDVAAGATELETIETAIAGLHEQMAEAARREQEAADQIAVLRREREEISARLAALRQIHDSGAGLYAGVRAVLDQARKGAIGGVRGTVAELVTVAGRFDTAIEVALGSHLQDVVVERWTDAEGAIELLRRTRGGRATFQPIDSVRPPRAQELDGALAGRAGVHGIAASLVDAAPELEAIVRSLLGRTVVVDDLPVAREVLPGLPPGWTAVTLTGELARSGGSVTGGSAVRESGVLGRERELREQPGRIADLDRQLAEAGDRHSTVAMIPRQIAGEIRAQEDRRAELTASRREQGAQRTRLGQWLEDLEREGATAGMRAEQLRHAAHDADAEQARLEGEAAALEERLAQARRAREEQTEKAGAESGRLQELETALSEEGLRLAALEERVRAEERRKTGLLAQRQALREELGLRGERFSAIGGEIEGVARQAERLEQEAAGLAAEQRRLEREIAPLREGADASAAGAMATEQELETARQGLLDAERRRSVAELGLERTRGELATLRQRIFDDLEMEEPDDLLAMDVALEDAFEEVGREISRLRERLRRVGYIGEEAVAEFEREAERHQFLRTQLDDVEGASSALRTLLVDLRITMQRRFDETFEKVAEAFAEAFTILFGGGTARLVLVANENGAGGGVDIVAQPPGKRLQSLALLSGGERALTAAALLFAILKVNPSPFVLLDEVDAALDEANIVRFREQLQALARETQAVIITHNRGTIEVADALYGVSMRDDGVSTVLSLRMTEAVQAG